MWCPWPVVKLHLNKLLHAARPSKADVDKLLLLFCLPVTLACLHHPLSSEVAGLESRPVGSSRRLAQSPQDQTFATLGMLRQQAISPGVPDLEDFGLAVLAAALIRQ